MSGGPLVDCPMLHQRSPTMLFPSRWDKATHTPTRIYHCYNFQPSERRHVEHFVTSNNRAQQDHQEKSKLSPKVVHTLREIHIEYCRQDPTPPLWLPTEDKLSSQSESICDVSETVGHSPRPPPEHHLLPKWNLKCQSGRQERLARTWCRYP